VLQNKQYLNLKAAYSFFVFAMSHKRLQCGILNLNDTMPLRQDAASDGCFPQLLTLPLATPFNKAHS
jgi:hypothetical protein